MIVVVAHRAQISNIPARPYRSDSESPTGGHTVYRRDLKLAGLEAWVVAMR
jgi:hypothetical protein